jgi:hypothetical protein
MMKADPIVRQVRAAREAYSKKFGFDLRRIAADLIEKQGTMTKVESPAAKPPKRRRKAA